MDKSRTSGFAHTKTKSVKLNCSDICLWFIRTCFNGKVCKHYSEIASLFCSPVLISHSSDGKDPWVWFKVTVLTARYHLLLRLPAHTQPTCYNRDDAAMCYILAGHLDIIKSYSSIQTGLDFEELEICRKSFLLEKAKIKCHKNSLKKNEYTNFKTAPSL